MFNFTLATLVSTLLSCFLAENALLSRKDVAKSILALPERKILDGYCLVGKIERTKEKFLVGQYHHCKFGDTPPPKRVEELHWGKYLPWNPIGAS